VDWQVSVLSSDHLISLFIQILCFFELCAFYLIDINILVCKHSTSPADRKEFIENDTTPFNCVDRKKHFQSVIVKLWIVESF